ELGLRLRLNGRRRRRERALLRRRDALGRIGDRRLAALALGDQLGAAADQRGQALAVVADLGGPVDERVGDAGRELGTVRGIPLAQPLGGRGDAVGGTLRGGVEVADLLGDHVERRLLDGWLRAPATRGAATQWKSDF